MDEINIKSLAKIGIGTKRKKREINLLEVAEEIKSLYSKYNSLEKVAGIVKVSPEMVREFLKINDLDEKVRKLIKSGLIKGVDIGYRISKLEKSDQAVLAKFIVDKNLSSEDVRLIVKYKIDNPKVDVENAANKIIKSKDKKIYVAYLGLEKDTFDRLSEKSKSKALEKTIRNIFAELLPKKLIVSFELNGRVVILKVVKEGSQKIREKAKMLGVPLANLGEALIRDYLVENKK
jgi:hypothetical protein